MRLFCLILVLPVACGLAGPAAGAGCDCGTASPYGCNGAYGSYYAPACAVSFYGMVPGCCVCPPSPCDNAWDGYCDEKAGCRSCWYRAGTGSCWSWIPRFGGSDCEDESCGCEAGGVVTEGSVSRVETAGEGETIEVDNRPAVPAEPVPSPDPEAPDPPEVRIGPPSPMPQPEKQAARRKFPWLW